MRNRREVIGLAVVLLAMGQVRLTAAEYSADLAQAERLKTQRQFPQALQHLARMLKQHKEPAQVKAVRLLQAECLLGAGKFDNALAEATAIQGAYAGDKAVQGRAMMVQAGALRGQKKFDESVAAYRGVAAAHADNAPLACAALLSAGDVCCHDLKKIPEALALYAQVERSFSRDASLASQGAARTAAVHETLTKDYVKAAASYQALAERYAAAFDENNRSAFYTRAIGYLQTAKKLPQAQAVAARAERALPSTQVKIIYAFRQADLLVMMKKHPQVRAECERIICTYPLEAATCQGAQGRIIQAYSAEKKLNEALGAARILYDAAGGENEIRAAAHGVALAFQALDGKVTRANQFLLFQRFGPAGADRRPNTPDDVRANHLATVRYPPSDAGRNTRFGRAIAAQPKNVRGYRARGYLYIYWGRPKEAAQSFRLAFKGSPEPQVPLAAQELVMVGMKAYTASFHDLARIFEYISHGPKGKSGKETIPNPFRGL